MTSFVHRTKVYDAIAESRSGDQRIRRPFAVGNDSLVIAPQSPAQSPEVSNVQLKFKTAVRCLLLFEGSEGQTVEIGNKSKVQLKAIDFDDLPEGVTRGHVVAFLAKHHRTKAYPALVDLVAKAQRVNVAAYKAAVALENDENDISKQKDLSFDA